METIQEIEGPVRPYASSLIEAFGLDPELTYRFFSVGRMCATFHCVGVVPGFFTSNAVLSRDASEPGVTTVEFHAEHWTDEQRQAVTDYLDQFPSESEPASTGVEVDKTRSHYEWSSQDEGQTGWVADWDGKPPNEGDYLILRNGKDQARYKVIKLKPCYNVDGMWIADVRHAPSTRP